MKCLLLKPRNRNGKKKYYPLIRHTASKYGPVLDEQRLHKSRRCIVITGAHDAGKTRMLYKLYDNAGAIWQDSIRPYSKSTRGKYLSNPDKPRLAVKRSDPDYPAHWAFPAPVFLSATEPLARWADHAAMATWYEAHAELNPEGAKFASLPAYKRRNLLSKYLEENRAMLFLDDAHKIAANSTKAELVKRCFNAASRVIMTAGEETRVYQSLRVPLMNSDPQIIRLDSDASYDATNELVWVAIVLCIIAGWWELAMVAGTFKIASGGLRGAKQT